MSDDIFMKKQKRRALIKAASRGAFTGLKLSFLYVLAWPIAAYLILIIVGVFSSGALKFESDDFLRIMLELSILYVLMIVVGSIIGVIPSTIIGMLTGLIMGSVIINFNQHLTRKNSLILGLTFGLLVALITMWVLGRENIDMIFFGVPSIIYIAACGWMSRNFYDDWVTGFTVMDQDFGVDD